MMMMIHNVLARLSWKLLEAYQERETLQRMMTRTMTTMQVMVMQHPSSDEYPRVDSLHHDDGVLSFLSVEHGQASSCHPYDDHDVGDEAARVMVTCPFGMWRGQQRLKHQKG